MTIKDFIPKTQFRYYYNQLNETDKEIYLKLLDGMLYHIDSIKCHCIAEHVQDIYHMVRYDIPELFYVKTIQIRFLPCVNSCTVLPIYRFGIKESMATLQALQEKYYPFICESRNLTAIEKEKAIHDLIASMVKYKDVDAPYSHEAPGTLLYNIGVCEGITKAFKYLADRIDLKSIVVVGSSNAHGNNNGHAWNVVEIGDDYYHLDVTFDATIADGCIRYDYFNLSDSEIQSNHSWGNIIPQCPISYNYYRRIGVYFESKSELAAYIRKESKKNINIVFQVPLFSGEKDTAIETIRKVVQKNISYNLLGVTKYYISYNTDRMVFQIQTHSRR